MGKWYLVWFHLKRLSDGSKWTQYLTYATSQDEAISKIEELRKEEGFLKWKRTEDTEAIEIEEEEWKSGTIKLYICT